MEINPITGIRAFPAKVTSSNAKNWAVFEIENSARTGDETYSPGRGKSADEDEDQYEETAEGQEEARAEAGAEAAAGDESEPKMLALDNVQHRKVSFFA